MSVEGVNMNTKNKSKYWMITILLLFFIIVPVITVFSEAIINNGRLDFMSTFKIIVSSDNLKTIMNSILLGILDRKSVV